MRWLWGILIVLIVGLGLEAQAASTITYFHNDLTGSPLVATDASGHVLWRESYRPYGERLVNSASAKGNDVWFTSRRQDAETGLVYMGARYYDLVAGRFVSSDPKGFYEKSVHSFNRYAYANDNPYRYFDPDGKQSAVVARATIAVTAILGVGIAVQQSPEERRRNVEATQRAWRGLLGIFNESTEDASASGAGSAQNSGQKTGQSGGLTGPESAPNPKDFEDPSTLPRGWEWRGRGQPGSREGAYHNPETGESMHDDRTHPAGKDPHWTYTDPDGKRWDNFGDGWKAQ